jgi:hypothetical protein
MWKEGGKEIRYERNKIGRGVKKLPFEYQRAFSASLQLPQNNGRDTNLHVRNMRSYTKQADGAVGRTGSRGVHKILMFHFN